MIEWMDCSSLLEHVTSESTQLAEKIFLKSGYCVSHLVIFRLPYL